MFFSENIYISLIISFDNWVVGDLILLNIVKVSLSKFVWISSWHLDQELSEMLLDLDRLPGVVDVQSINPERWWLLWVVLSTKEWVVLGLNGCDERRTVWHQAVRGHVPELFEVSVCLKSGGSNAVSVAVVSIVIWCKLLSFISQALVHSGILRIFVKDEWEADMVEVKLTPWVKASRCGVCYHVLVPETSSPSWVKGAVVIVIFKNVKDILTKLIVVTIASWEQDTIELCDLILNCILWFIVDDWNNSGSCSFNILNVCWHDVVAISREFLVGFHLVFKSLGQDTNNWLLIEINVILPNSKLAPRIMLEERFSPSRWCIKESCL